VFVDWPYDPRRRDQNVLDVAVDPAGLLWVSTLDTIWVISGPPPVSADPEVRLAALSVAPNPFSSSSVVRIPGGVTLDRLEILDASGRRLREWNGPLRSSLVWDGRDRDGHEVPAGIYWFRAGSSGAVTVRRVVRLTP
jgi:hypothetical protein